MVLKRIGALLVALALAVGTLVLVAPAASAAVSTHTILLVARERCSVGLEVGAQHWAPRRHRWVASRGQYVKLQVWRSGRWRYIGALDVQISNNPAWAVGTWPVHRCRRHTYRAVTPPVKVGSTYRAGSHSLPETG